MKKLITLWGIFMLIFGFVVAQSPQALNYQAVARDGAGQILSNQAVSFRFSIREASASGTVVYQETHSITTNDFGLVTLQMGQGAVVSGSFGNVDWGANTHFLEVEMDPAGGSSYVVMGTSQFLSVPYALHAETVTNDNVDDADADPTNELQTLSLSNDTLSISSGNAVVLPAPPVDNDWTVSGNDQYSSVSGNVGIGTAAPAEKLHVNGDARIDGLASVNGSGVVTTDTDGTLSRLDFNGSTTQYLRGDGTWGTPAGGSGGSSVNTEVKSIWTLSTDYVVNTSFVRIYSYGTSNALRIENPHATKTLRYAYSLSNGTPVIGNLSPASTLDLTNLSGVTIDIRCSLYSTTTDDFHCTFMGVGMANGHIRGHVLYD